jgi:biopolymer transport protein ExbD
MVVGKKSINIDVEIPTAAMPDIVFMLLIFFLVTTTITSDKGVPLTLPEFSENNDPVKLKKNQVLNLLVSDMGQVMIDGQVLTNRSDLKNQIRNSLDQLGRDAEGKYKKIVSIKTQGGTLYQDYIYVLDNVKEAGATKISIAEPEE